MQKSSLYRSICSSVPASSSTDVASIRVSGRGTRNAPRFHSPATVSPAITRTSISASVLPASGVPAAVASAMQTRPKRPSRCARASVAMLCLASARPMLSPSCRTCVLPASWRISTDDAVSAVVTIGTLSLSSRTVKATLQFIGSGPLATTIAARSACSFRYVFGSSGSP